MNKDGLEYELKDGYYLFLYVAVGELAHLNKLFLKHDQNISLFRKEGLNVELVRYWELERVTGIKQHDRAFYDIEHVKRVCNDLLAPMNLSLNDMAGIFGCPELDTSDFYRKAIPKNIAFHSLLHMYSGLLMDSELYFHSKLLCLAVDGGPDSALDDGASKKYHYCGAYVDHGKMEGPYNLISPGILWAYMAKILGLKEGTLMALGSATTCRMITDEYDEVYQIFNDHQGQKAYFGRVDRLWERISKLTREDEQEAFVNYDERFSLEENRISMLVKVIQQISINTMEANVKDAIERFNIIPQETTLCITGGYALNCGTNSYLMKKYGFREFIAPPCVNDSGLSLGLSLFVFHMGMGYFKFRLQNSYHGEGFEKISGETQRDFSDFIESMEIADDELIVDDIKTYPIIWFDGNAEIGPRALGHRSLIADPRSNKTKDILNEIKQRQWWRPVAPIVMQEHLDEWFEDASPSPFMLQTFLVKEKKWDVVPAIEHLDHSARVQTMQESDNPVLYRVLKCFYGKTGVPIICNTSLNDKGEPIINSISEAFNFALRKNMPIMYVNGLRIKLKNHSLYKEKTFLKRPIHFDVYANEHERHQMVASNNPLNLSDELLKWKYRFYGFREYDIANPSDVKKMKTIIGKLNAMNGVELNV